eukprot:1158026-Pelagomonas_calceolata.AAC.1
MGECNLFRSDRGMQKWIRIVTAESAQFMSYQAETISGGNALSQKGGHNLSISGSDIQCWRWIVAEGSVKLSMLGRSRSEEKANLQKGRTEKNV